jgi:hypothetical protein
MTITTFIRWFFLEPSSSIKFPFGVEVSAPPFIIILALGGFVGSIIWVARDAKQRGKSSLLAGLFAGLALWPVSLVVWLWLRPRYITKI